MDGQYGIQSCKEVLDLGFAVGAAFKNAKADGHIDASDLGQLIPVFAVVSPALKDVGNVPKELSELSEAEAKELLAYAGQKLPQVTDDAKLIKRVNAALKLGVSVAECIKEFKDA